MSNEADFACAAQKQLIEEALRNKYLCPASQNILSGVAGRQNIAGGTLQAASIRPKSPVRSHAPQNCDCAFYKSSSKPGAPLGKRLSLSSDLPDQVIPPPNYPRKLEERLSQEATPSQEATTSREARRVSAEQTKRSELEKRPYQEARPSREARRLSGDQTKRAGLEENPSQQAKLSRETSRLSAEQTLRLQSDHLVRNLTDEIQAENKEIRSGSRPRVETSFQLQEPENLNPTPMADSERTRVMDKMKMSQSRILYALNMIREPVVEYQEGRGVPRNEEITFVTLITSLCTQAYTAGITILVMLWNLMPLVDGFVYFLRFLLDKTIDIIQTEDNKDRVIKSVILFAELTVIFFLIFMIVGLIFMPVYVLMARLFSKVFSMIAW